MFYPDQFPDLFYFYNDCFRCFFFFLFNPHIIPSKQILRTEYKKNATHIFNCHLCGASELKQVAMAAPSS